MEPLLILNGILFRRGEFALTIDSLQLESAHLYLLQGPNGAGKSTLLQLLALLLQQQRGTLRYSGRLVDGAADRQQIAAHP